MGFWVSRSQCYIEKIGTLTFHCLPQPKDVHFCACLYSVLSSRVRLSIQSSFKGNLCIHISTARGSTLAPLISLNPAKNMFTFYATRAPTRSAYKHAKTLPKSENPLSDTPPSLHHHTSLGAITRWGFSQAFNPPQSDRGFRRRQRLTRRGLPRRRRLR